jgi:GntR family transcriptional regulator
MKLIESSQVHPGDQLPTTRALAIQLGINFNTVARAYRHLDRLGVISTQPGRGTFISDPQKRKSSPKINQRSIEELTRAYIRQASYLGFDSQEIQDSLEKIVQSTKDQG